MNAVIEPVCQTPSRWSRRAAPLAAAVAAVATLASSSPASAVDIKVNDDNFIKLNLLLQPWVVIANDPLSDTDVGTDFFVRRTRIVLQGQVSSRVSFFMETDNPNWGKAGSWTPDFFVQDAYVTFDIVPDAMKLDVGMLLPPFVHQSRQAATSLHTLDYHSDIIKFPKPNKAWRDAGIEIRGVPLDKKLDYRLTITNGKVGTKSDIPRFTGRLAYNFFDAEDGNFLGGTYLGKKKVFSIGAAFDAQPDIVDGEKAYYAFGGDVFWDIPMETNRLSGQLDFVYYNGLDGKKTVTNPDGTTTSVDALLDTTGMGILFDVGYAFGDWEPVLAFDWFKPKAASEMKDQFLGVHLGLNWWMQGHNANVKFDLGLVKAAGREFGDAARVLTIQTQLLF